MAGVRIRKREQTQRHPCTHRESSVKTNLGEGGRVVMEPEPCGTGVSQGASPGAPAATRSQERGQGQISTHCPPKEPALQAPGFRLPVSRLGGHPCFGLKRPCLGSFATAARGDQGAVERTRCAQLSEERMAVAEDPWREPRRRTTISNESGHCVSPEARLFAYRDTDGPSFCFHLGRSNSHTC